MALDKERGERRSRETEDVPDGICALDSVRRGGQSDQLLETLDRDVTVVDPRAAEETFERDFEGVRTPEDVERAAAEGLKRRLESGDDVPLIEDFPLAPEEETPEFSHLAATLEFRFVRAFEHWQGNTHLTLTAIIMRTVQQNMGLRGGQP